MGQTAQKIFDQALRRQIHIGRFSKKLGFESVKLLRQAEKEILSKLAANELTDFGRKRFENMLISIREINNTTYQVINSGLTKELRSFTKDELRFNVKSIQQAYPIKLMLDRPATSQVFAAAMAKPFEGAVLKDWMTQVSSSNIRKLDEAIKIGFIEGESIGQITRRIQRVYKISKKGATALTRTAVNHVSQVARENLYSANKELFKGIKWVSTLDGRTTPICQKRDGRTYPINEGPRPPAHWNCRSTTVPITKSWKELGLDDLKETDKLSKRPFVVDTRRVSDIPKSERNIGITAADESYPQWLKRQRPDFIRDVLGKTRGDLFIDNKVTFGAFSDPTGKLYNLDALRKREDLALSEIPSSPAPVETVEFKDFTLKSEDILDTESLFTSFDASVVKRMLVPLNAMTAKSKVLVQKWSSLLGVQKSKVSASFYRPLASFTSPRTVAFTTQGKGSSKLQGTAHELFHHIDDMSGPRTTLWHSATSNKFVAVVDKLKARVAALPSADVTRFGDKLATLHLGTNTAWQAIHDIVDGLTSGKRKREFGLRFGHSQKTWRGEHALYTELSANLFQAINELDLNDRVLVIDFLNSELPELLPAMDDLVNSMLK